MSRPLQVVVVGDSRNTALRIAADLEQCGYEPAFELASSDAQLSRAAAAGCELVLASRDSVRVPPERALAVMRIGGHRRPLIVWGEAFTDEDIVALVRAGAHDCVRKGDLHRLRTAVERELEAEVEPSAETRPNGVDASAGDRYRALIEEIPALTYVAWADETGSRAYVSPQLLAMTGYTPSEWLAEPDMWARCLHPQDRERVLHQFRQACESTGRFASEYRINDRDGRLLWWRDEGRVIPGPDGRPRFLRGFVLDVTEEKLGEERVRQLRYFDAVTGLPNRLHMYKDLGRRLAESSASGRPLALLILALDRFRDVVATLGHHIGENLVREIAGRLGDVLGRPERVSRLRGDEFGVLVPDADGPLARQVGERLLASLEKPFMVQGLPIEVGASVGLVVAPEHGEEAELLLRRADAAVQAARRLGSGACITYGPEHEPHDPRRLALLGELRQSLEANQLTLHYQPKIDLRTRGVVGAEALLRWPHPRRGMVPPAEFIPLAEQAGLIRSLTRWVIRRALADAKGFARNGQTLPVAVNVSARNLQDGRILDDVNDALAGSGVGPDRLQVEVTESAVMTDPVRAAETLARLSHRGISISIDDFGQGYTSIGLLRRLPVTEIKIDNEFVRGMVGNGVEDTAIVRLTNDLGHNLGLSVVAEGVEDERTMEMLSTFGCDSAQGYYIARPMPSADFQSWLGNGAWPAASS